MGIRRFIGCIGAGGKTSRRDSSLLEQAQSRIIHFFTTISQVVNVSDVVQQAFWDVLNADGGVDKFNEFTRFYEIFRSYCEVDDQPKTHQENSIKPISFT